MLLKLAVLTALIAASVAVLSDDYESLTAVEKQQILWGLISKNPYPLSDLPSAPANLSMAVKFLSPPLLVRVFSDPEYDEINAGREKLSHRFGSAAKVELQIFQNSTYTGIFQAGSNNAGIARLTQLIQDPENFNAGMSVKVFVSDKPAINIITMFTLDGQGNNMNFFQHPLSNYLPTPVNDLAWKVDHQFREGLKLFPGRPCEKPIHETKLPLYRASTLTADGDTVAEPYGPEVLQFIPRRGLGWDPKSPKDMRLHLAEIPAGTVLYAVAAKASEHSKSTIIGQLVLQSKFIASEYEDKTLFFHHAPKSAECPARKFFGV